MKRPIIMQVVRHSFKKDGTKTNLSHAGVRAALKAGRLLAAEKCLKGYKVATRHGIQPPRVESSAKLQAAGFRAKGGKTYKKSRPRKSFNLLTYVRNKEAIRELLGQQGELKVNRDWLDNAISSDIVQPPAEVADNIVKEEIAFGKFLEKYKKHSLAVRHFSQGVLGEAVFERLTGKRLDKEFPRNPILNENEALTFVFAKGRIKLKFRNRVFDVTELFNRIVGSK